MLSQNDNSSCRSARGIYPRGMELHSFYFEPGLCLAKKSSQYTGGVMQIYEALKKDHEKVKSLLGELIANLMAPRFMRALRERGSTPNVTP